MKIYSFINTVVIVNGVELTGWADGDDVIKISRRTDAASDKIGADGSMMVALSADKSGEFVFKLMQTSPSNKYLSGLTALQENSPKTFIPCVVLFQDSFRNDLSTGTLGYIKKQPEVQRGMAGNAQEWTVVVERLDLLLGDPPFLSTATAVLS